MATPNKAQLQGEATALGLPTNGTNAQLKERITSFEYDAIVDKKRRRAPATKKASYSTTRSVQSYSPRHKTKCATIP